MLNLATLDLFLSIDAGQLLDDFVLTLLASPQVNLFLQKFPALKKALLERQPQMKRQLARKLRETPLPAGLAKEFYLFQQCQQMTPDAFSAALPSTLAQLLQFSSPFYPQGRQLAQSAGADGHQGAFPLLFMQRWHASLTLQAVAMHRQLLDQERELLLEELQRQLSASSALLPLLADNDAAAGRLWDMSADLRQTGDFRLLVRYGDILQQQPELQELAARLGRGRTSDSIASPPPSKHSPPDWQRVREREPAVQPEQLSGVHQSDDLLRLLPAEQAMLGLDELEYEFYRRLLEKRLLTYRLQGESWRERWMKHPTQDNRRQPQPKGPFIVCVDTSGSMGGFNEACAKAFCLALMRIALADNRRCFITLFSTGQVDYELTSASGLSQAMRFLGQRFRGGTDLSACLAAVADRLDQPQWRDADAVVISDFIAQRLPDGVVKRISEKRRLQHQRFHAVALSTMGKPGILRIFDHIWYFDTGLRQRLLRRLRRGN